MKVYRRGKVKDVYEHEGENTLIFVFSDRISVFDKVIPTPIPRKGQVLCLTAAHWFEVAASLGIKSHFLGLKSPTEMKVKKYNIIKDYSKIRPRSVDFVVPLEFISRYYVAGSLYERLRRGKLKPTDLGFRSNSVPAYGEELPEPYLEITTKFESYDRSVSMVDAMKLASLSREKLEEIFEIILTIDERIRQDVARRRLIHVDGKKEFALDKDRLPVLIDTFGTPDEDRWWDADAYDEGKCVELSKEVVRQYYKQTSYYESLMSARRRREPEPEIPPLPDSVVEKTSRMYVEMYRKITGKNFYEVVEQLTHVAL